MSMEGERGGERGRARAVTLSGRLLRLWGHPARSLGDHSPPSRQRGGWGQKVLET